MYVDPKPEGSFGPGLRNVRLFPDDGALLILDAMDEQIACIEPDRDDVGQKLLAVLPCDSPSGLGEAAMFRPDVSLERCASPITGLCEHRRRANTRVNPCP